MGAAPPRPGTTTSSSRPSTLVSHSSGGASGETEVEAWNRAWKLEGYVCVSMARPRPCSRGGICRGQAALATRGVQAPSRVQEQEGKGAGAGLQGGLEAGARQRPAPPRWGSLPPLPEAQAPPRTHASPRWRSSVGPRGRGKTRGGGCAGADLSMMLLRELLAPSCLDPEPLPGPPAQQAPRTPRCLRPSSRCVKEPPWSRGHDPRFGSRGY